MKTVQLNNGVLMPVAGYGVFQLDDGQTQQAVSDALKAGYRSIDTASAYGNEAAVGRAIRQGGIPRDELFITSKLWLSDAGYEATKAAFEKTLIALQLDYLDLYLIHQPYGDIFGSWRAMEELYAAGKIRAIGVSNFSAVEVLNLGLFNTVKPAVDQIEVNPWMQQPEQRQLLTAQGVQVEAWAPFSEGKHDLFNHPVISQIAAKYHRSVGQVVLRWLDQSGAVVISKSLRPKRMAENLASDDFDLTETDMVAITKLNKNEALFMNYEDPQTVQFLAKSVGKTWQ